MGEERQALGLAFSESAKSVKKKKKKRAGQGIDTGLPVMFKNEEGVFMYVRCGRTNHRFPRVAVTSCAHTVWRRTWLRAPALWC